MTTHRSCARNRLRALKAGDATLSTGSALLLRRLPIVFPAFARL